MGDSAGESSAVLASLVAALVLVLHGGSGSIGLLVQPVLLVLVVLVVLGQAVLVLVL
jgi:hypothetical protein